MSIEEDSVTDPKEKVENITQYCSRNVREFMEGLPSYSSGEWLKFTQDLLEYFDAERDDKRYHCNDLEAFCLKARKDKTHMRMSRWKDYSREFICIAGWLVTHKKISANEQALYFWKGIPKTFRAQLESCLLAIDPSHDLETPFEINDIHKLAKSMLQRNRFDHDRLPSDGEDSSTSSDEASESDSNSESSESEEETTTRKSKDKKKKSKKRKTAIRKKDPVPVNETEVKRTSYKLNQDEEMENLIAQMGRMSLTDPSYAILYYRAFRLNSVVADIMTRPVDRPRGSRPGMSNDFIANRPNNNPPARPPPPGGNAFRTFQQEERKCYGCGGSGHGMFSCPEMNDLLRSGSVIRDQAGRYTLPDGAIIRRQSPEETLAAAARRLKPVQANYVSVHQAVIKEKFLDNSEEDYEDFYDDDFSYLATRNSKQTQEARRGFQGVFPPARTKHADEHPRRHIVKQDTHVELPSTGKVTKNPVPVDVNPPAFDPEDVNMFVDDPPKAAATNKPDIISKSPAEIQAILKRIPRQSEIQAQVDRMNVLGRVLSQPVTLAVGEIFGISKEMTHHLQDVLKLKPTVKSNLATELLKPVETPPMVATSFTSKTRGTLIKLRMECDGNPVSAIIDTGSQLNIAHKRIWKSTLSRPVDMHHSVNMSDASGGESVLKGLVSNVPLTCGSVVTHANLYVGDRVPFDLLLGRPWQRGNFVSIDERSDGTYLLFKDQNLDVRHELLVTPEESPPSNEESEFIDRTRSARPFVNVITTTKRQARRREHKKGKVSVHRRSTLKTKFTEKVTHRHVKDEKKSECDHCPRNGHDFSKCRSQHQRTGHEDVKTTDRSSHRREVSNNSTQENEQAKALPQRSLLDRLARPCTTCGHAQTSSRFPSIEPATPDQDTTRTSSDEEAVNKSLLPEDENEDSLLDKPIGATRIRGGCSGSDDGGDWELCEKFEREQEEWKARKDREKQLRRTARERYQERGMARREVPRVEMGGGKNDLALQPSETLCIIGANEHEEEPTDEDNGLLDSVWEEEPIRGHLRQIKIQDRRRPNLPQPADSSRPQIGIRDGKSLNEKHEEENARAITKESSHGTTPALDPAKSQSGCGEPKSGTGTKALKEQPSTTQEYPEHDSMLRDKHTDACCMISLQTPDNSLVRMNSTREPSTGPPSNPKKRRNTDRRSNGESTIPKKAKTNLVAPRDNEIQSQKPFKVREGIAALFDNRRTYVPTSLGFILKDKATAKDGLAFKTGKSNVLRPGFPISDERTPLSLGALQLGSASSSSTLDMDNSMSVPPHRQLTFESTEFHANFPADFDQLVGCIGKSIPLGPGGLESLRTFVRDLSVEPSTTFNVSGQAHLLQPPDDAQHLVAMIAPDSTLVRRHDTSSEELNVSHGLALITFVRDSFIERWEGIRLAETEASGSGPRSSVEDNTDLGDRERTVSTSSTLELPDQDTKLTGGDHQALEVLLTLARSRAPSTVNNTPRSPSPASAREGEHALDLSSPTACHSLIAPKPSIPRQISAIEHAATLSDIYADHNRPTDKDTQVTRVASPCGPGPYEKLIWVTHDGEVSVTHSPSPPLQAAHPLPSVMTSANVYHIAEVPQEVPIFLESRQLHPQFIPLKKQSAQGFPRRPTPYPTTAQRHEQSAGWNGTGLRATEVHGTQGLVAMFAAKLKLLTSAYSPASPTHSSYSLGSLDTIISEDTEIDEDSFTPIFDAFPPVPNNSPAKVWLSPSPVYEFTMADMIRFQQDAQSGIMSPLDHDNDSRLRAPPTGSTPTTLPHASIEDVNDGFLLSYPSASSIPPTPPFLPIGTYRRHDTSPVPSTLSSWMDDIEPYNEPLTIDNSYAAQFDPTSIHRRFKNHLAYDPEVDKDPLLNCRQIAAKSLKTAEDHVRLYQRRDWVQKEVLNRPLVSDPQGMNTYIDAFVVPNNDDPMGNPFLWGVERCHAHQCVRWLNGLPTPSPYDLIVRDDLVALLSYRLNDPGAIEYVNARRNRGDFGPPGGWAPLQTRIDLELADYHGGFLRLR
ncbi:hypothetical protein QCA50_009714 [Cerrena zonata]|uniref:CCHC-type domain-containing protein n=1 Tax=Cerrena zonata TaxID=2478898 RepID=A0AAW0G685_9APHY